MKKYEMIKVRGGEYGGLFQIRALRNFGKIKKGDLGGYVQTDKNLSHDGLCWIAKGGRVLDNAQISGDAQIGPNVTIVGSARISGAIRVSGGGDIAGAFNVKSTRTPKSSDTELGKYGYPHGTRPTGPIYI